VNENEKAKGVVDGLTELVKAVPIYQDALQPAAKELGESLKVVAKTVKMALSPLRVLIWGWDRIEDYLATSVAEKLGDTPHDRIHTPSPALAGPAIEAMRFVGPEPALRELYAKLLATAMDRETAQYAHPAYVEIIRQLTPDEARIVTLFAQKRQFPVVSVLWVEPTAVGPTEAPARRMVNAFNVHLRNFSLLAEEAGCSFRELAPTYIDNLIRMRLIEKPDGLEAIDEALYAPLESHAKVTQCISSLEKDRDPQKGRIETDRGILQVTDFGQQFVRACVATTAAATEGGS